MHWRKRLVRLFPNYVKAGFSKRHEDFWDWVDSIRRGERTRPLVACWPRGGGKSTSAELAVVTFATRLIDGMLARTYVLYISETQDQADKHVASIAAPLESIGVERAVNKYGSSKGWRRERLVTADGFVVDAIGFDTAARGVKFEEQRPDLIIIDDIDNRHDSKEVIRKKVEILTDTLLPTGSPDVAILFVQNLIHSRSIMATLVNGTADFLQDRIVSGPFKALEGFKYEFVEGLTRITAGIASWAGQSVAICQNYIANMGLRAFLRECQQQVGDVQGALWSMDGIDSTRVKQAPDLYFEKCVALDPAVTSKDSSDEHGIIVGGANFYETSNGKQRVKHGFVEADYTLRGKPNEWAVRVIAAYVLHNCTIAVGEGNNGGEMIETVLRGISRETVVAELIKLGMDPEQAEKRAIDGKQIRYQIVHATQNKETRAEPVSNAYSEGRVHHIGMLADLEEEQTTWVPGRGRSPNRIDALVWCMTKLGVGKPQGVFIG